MLVPAVGSMFAEPTRVPRALVFARLGVDVLVHAVVAIAAVAVLGVEPALGHLVQVVFVQKLAPIALLAQPADPVLAYDRFDVAGTRVGGVPELAGASLVAPTQQE